MTVFISLATHGHDRIARIVREPLHRKVALAAGKAVS
jgi:hypothetical protein